MRASVLNTDACEQYQQQHIL